MRIISCHIDGFGKLKNLDFTFDDLTVIYEKNGFGKTTLAQFLKAMLYGLPPSSKRTNFLSERDLYRPFEYDGKFGGKLTFCCSKGEFVVLRSFGATPTLDKFTLIDLKTNLLSNEFSANLGEELFGVGKESFENSIFFEQQNLYSGINDDMRASLSTGVLSGDDVDNFAKAQEKLQKKIRDFKAEVKALRLDDLKEEVDKLEAKEDIIKIKIQNINDQIKQAENLKKQISKDSIINSKKDVDNFVNKKIGLESVLQAYKQQYAEKYEKLALIEKSTKLSQNDYDFLKDNKAKTAMKLNICSLIGIILTIFGVIGLILGGIMKQNILLYSSLSVVIFFLLTTFVCFIFSNHYRNDLKHFKTLRLKTNMSAKQLMQEEERYRTYEADFKLLKEDLNNLEIEISKSTQKITLLKQEFQLQFGCSIEELNFKNDSSQEKLSYLDKNLIELNADKKHLLQDFDNLQERKFDVSENLLEKQEKYTLLQQKLLLLSKTIDFLEKSKDSISHRFIEPVTERFNKYYKNILLDGEKIIVDSNLQLKFGDYKETDYLSAGLFDLVYICKRFALVDLLFKKEKPIMILDDPFVNLDDENLKRAKNLIKELSQEYQIIMMTCQKSRI